MQREGAAVGAEAARGREASVDRRSWHRKDQPWQSGRCWAPTSEHIPPEISVGKNVHVSFQQKWAQNVPCFLNLVENKAKERGKGRRTMKWLLFSQSAWPSASEWRTVVLGASGLSALARLAGEQHVLLGEQTDGKRFLQEHGP